MSICYSTPTQKWKATIPPQGVGRAMHRGHRCCDGAHLLSYRESLQFDAYMLRPHVPARRSITQEASHKANAFLQPLPCAELLKTKTKLAPAMRAFSIYASLLQVICFHVTAAVLFVNGPTPEPPGQVGKRVVPISPFDETLPVVNVKYGFPAAAADVNARLKAVRELGCGVLHVPLCAYTISHF
eukprot:2642613-Amphidinium_carterae.1